MATLSLKLLLNFTLFFLCLPPYVALDPTNPPHVISKPACTCECVPVGVSAHSCACIWRWFRSYLPANKEAHVLLTKNTGLLSNNSLAAALRWSCDSYMTSLQPNFSCVFVCVCVLHIVLMCLCMCEHACVFMSRCHS